ncbi:MAG: aminotransferase class V-fold PLP-dependent enzyme [Acidimicrobiales bacterium]
MQASGRSLSIAPPIALVGDGLAVPCIDGTERPYVSFDTAASTAALPAVLERVQDLVPWYSSIHRGAGYKSQICTAAYEDARDAALRFAGRTEPDSVAIFCRNTTEALNHLAYRLCLSPDDVVVSTVVEHHANLLPWSRTCRCRYVECGESGTFTIEDVERALDEAPKPKLLTITGASNITGWIPPIDAIIDAAHTRGIRVVVDGAQLAPHRPLPVTPDFIAWSAHKMYAPFGAGVLVGPRSAFTEGDPFLAGGGAVDLVDLDEVVWTAPPDKEEAGSPNVVGAVALHAAIDVFEQAGWPALEEHDIEMARILRNGLASIPNVRVLGPDLDTETLPVASFVVENVAHPLVAARLAAEDAIGVRHGCFCAHPYLTRLLGMSDQDVALFRDEVMRGDRTRMPGAVRASAGINTSVADVERLLDAVARIAGGDQPPVVYHQDTFTGDFVPDAHSAPWQTRFRAHRSSCSPG